MTAAVLGPSFPLEDAAAMLGRTSAALLPAVEEMMAAGLLAAVDDGFCFRHELLRRAVRDTIPPPGRTALHRQYGQLLLRRGDAADRAAGHLLRAAQGGRAAALADLDTAVAQTLRSAPPTAADLAVRVLELTPSGGPDELPRAVAAAEALAAAGRLEQAGRIASDTLAKPLPPRRRRGCDARCRRCCARAAGPVTPPPRPAWCWPSRSCRATCATPRSPRSCRPWPGCGARGPGP